MDITSLFLHISTTDICVVVAGCPGAAEPGNGFSKQANIILRILDLAQHSFYFLWLTARTEEKQHFNLKSSLINATLFYLE